MCDEGLENAGRFEPTRWDLVARALAGDQEAIKELYSRYYPPLVTYLMGKFQFPKETAADLAQGFFYAKILKGNLLSKAAPARGKFRNLLCTALRNFALDWLRREVKLCPLEESEVERLAAEPTVEEVLDDTQRIAIDFALRQTEAHYRKQGKLLFWELFTGRIVKPMLDDQEPLPFAQYIKPTRTDGFESPQQAFNALLDAKRTFKRFLKEFGAEFEL